MNLQTQPLVGSGTFQWNTGGWFGATVGSSLWMLVTAGFLFASQQLWVALIPLACFLIVNGLGFALWARRDRVRPFNALIIWLYALAIVLPVVWITTVQLGSDNALARMNWPRSSLAIVPVCLAAPALMLWFWFLEGRWARRTASDEQR